MAIAIPIAIPICLQPTVPALGDSANPRGASRHPLCGFRRGFGHVDGRRRPRRLSGRQTRCDAFLAQTDRHLTGGRWRVLSAGVGSATKATAFVISCVAGARDFKSVAYAVPPPGRSRSDCRTPVGQARRWPRHSTESCREAGLGQIVVRWCRHDERQWAGAQARQSVDARTGVCRYTGSPEKSFSPMRAVKKEPVKRRGTALGRSAFDRMSGTTW